jgi:Pvc16 N-terminal domain
MATGNLALVTASLRTLLGLNVRALLNRAGLDPTLNVTSMPPERVGAETRTLNIYLYHVLEDPHSRNVVPPGIGTTPVARVPLTLSLFYILTAHHQINDVFDAETQQLLFGLAMKTFHDVPRVTDTLQISPDGGAAQPVMPLALAGRGNAFEIALRPLTAEEALSFWHADDTATTRLAAYYEIRPVSIEPELPANLAGTVFDIGLFINAGQAPRIDRTIGLTQFAPPAATGLAPQVIENTPARATLAPGLPIGPVNRVTLAGSRLAGDGQPGSSTIILRSAMWQSRLPPVRNVRVDPDRNPAWNVVIQADRASFDMQAMIDSASIGPAMPIETTPGIYAVSIESVRTLTTLNGTVRRSVSESSQIGFSLGARIAGAAAPDAAGRIAVTLVNLFDFTATGLDVVLAVDGEVYTEVPAFTETLADDVGCFVRLAGELRFQPAFDATIPGTHPLRLVINGAESQPFWVVLP